MIIIGVITLHKYLSPSRQSPKGFLLVIKRKQKHRLFNQNLNLDNNDYLFLLLIILILDGISQHLLYRQMINYWLNISYALAACCVRIKKLGFIFKKCCYDPLGRNFATLEFSDCWQLLLCNSSD